MRNLELNCSSCPDRMPNLIPENYTFMSFWNICGNCFHYVAGGMGGVVPMALNWHDIKVLADIHGVKLDKILVSKLKVAEAMSIKEFISYAQKKGGK